MTFEECTKNYDVSLYYHSGETVLDKKLNIKKGWYWTVECGYQCFDAHNPSPTPQDAYNELVMWLATWEGPTK